MTSAASTLSLFASLREGESRSGQGPRDVPGAPADAQLVALAREAPADALEAMYGAYKGRIYTFLLRFVGDPELADDVTQETFAKAYGAFGSLTSGHRVLPGEGVAPLKRIVEAVRKKKYAGALSVELMEPSFLGCRCGVLVFVPARPRGRRLGLGSRASLEHARSVLGAP